LEKRKGKKAAAEKYEPIKGHFPGAIPMLKRLEQSFQREINVTRYSEKEFKQKIQNKDHFLLSVLNEKVVMIKGALDELEAARLI